LHDASGRRQRIYEDFEGAAFDFFGLAWIDEAAGGKNERAGAQDGGLPVVPEASLRHGAWGCSW
jgi:hypothetical protein